MDTFTRSNYYIYALKKKLIEESSDTIKLLLMRTGFVFDRADHAALKNIKANTGAIDLVWAAADQSVSRASGSFITDGLVEGNLCTSDDASNPGPFTVASVAADKVIFNEAVVNSSATKTLTWDDELLTGHGYTQNTMTTGTVTVTQDNTYNRTDSTFPTVDWTATSDSIGPTPGAIIYDSTADVIIGYLQFSEEKTAANGEHLYIGNGTIRGE